MEAVRGDMAAVRTDRDAATADARSWRDKHAVVVEQCQELRQQVHSQQLAVTKWEEKLGRMREETAAQREQWEEELARERELAR